MYIQGWDRPQKIIKNGEKGKKCYTTFYFITLVFCSLAHITQIISSTTTSCAPGAFSTPILFDMLRLCYPGVLVTNTQAYSLGLSCLLSWDDLIQGKRDLYPREGPWAQNPLSHTFWQVVYHGVVKWSPCHRHRPATGFVFCLCYFTIFPFILLAIHMLIGASYILY